MINEVRAEPNQCPCGSGKGYDLCCGRYHKNQMTPLTAEQLMRSRYSAFVCGRIDYLEETLLPNKRRDFDATATAIWNSNIQWLGLEIKEAQAGSPNDIKGTVSFEAKFEESGLPSSITEVSEFRKRDGRWFYVKGRN